MAKRHGALYVRGQWWARWTCHLHHEHRKVARPDTAKAARDLAGKMRRQIEQHRTFPGEQCKHEDACCPKVAIGVKAHTIAAILQAFLDATETTRRSHGHDAARAKRIKLDFGTDTAATLTVKAVEDFKLGLAQEFSEPTANQYLRLLRAVINHGRKHRWWIGDNPISPLGVKLYSEQPYERSRCLTHEEEARLLGKLPSWCHPLIHVAAHTGVRKGNLFDLRWQDVDLSKGTFTIHREKSGKRREVVLNSVALEALRSIKRDRQIVSPLVFSSPEGKSLRNNFDKRYWRLALKAAQIPDFRFHDLRGTFASRLSMAGFGDRTVAEAGGWSDTRMLKRYVHLNPEYIRAAVERLAKAPSRMADETRSQVSVFLDRQTVYHITAP